MQNIGSKNLYKTIFPLASSKALLLRFCSLVPCISTPCKRPRTNQGRTKDEPKNPKIEKSTFVKIAILFPSLIPCLIPPTDDRENTERRAKRYRALAAKNSALFLRLLPKKVDSSPKKVDSLPKNVSWLCLLIPNHIRVFFTSHL